uniref:Uncharacterized protein n=1 Tax=viral metagenome TaxID=1070528 RepID=A0A6C0HEK6_9ZZZZ
MSTITTFWISTTIGIALFTLTLLFGYLHTTYGIDANFLKWLLLPTLGYAITIGLNSFLQSTVCGKVRFQQIAMGSLTVPIAILFFLILSLSSFIRSPIESAIPYSLRAKYAGLFAVGFYMFWAGMFGESISSGFAQSCPKA